jgi:histidinol-phosphate phosphatase family protein
MKQAAILAGGRGTRLSHVFRDIPKSMVPVAGRPLLEIVVETLAQQGIRELVLFTGFQAEQIESYVGDGRRWDISIRYVTEKSPMGTAGSLMQNLHHMHDVFLVVYGDTLFHVDLNRFLKFHRNSRADLTLFLHPNDHPYDSDLVETESDGRVTAFHKSPHAEGTFYRNLVNAALYIVQKKALQALEPRIPLDFVRDIFPAMLKRGCRLFGYSSREYIKDMGTPDRYEKVHQDFVSGKIERGDLSHKKAAVFVDRDGTLTRSTDYVRKLEELDLFSFGGRAVARLNSSHYLTVLVTNQPVIARGEMSESELRQLHNKLETLLGQERAFLDGLYVCQHHPEKGFEGERPELKIDCDCRKPKIGLIKEAAEELNIDGARSWFVGDTTTDMQTARNAGLRSILVRTGYGGRDRKFKVRPDFEVADLEEAVDFIVAGYERIRSLLKPLVRKVRQSQYVVLGGPARSGKSLVASTLRQMLGSHAMVVSLDHWLKPAKGRGPTVDQHYDLKAFSSFLQGLSSAQELVLPYYDRHTQTVDPVGYREAFRPPESLVFEGTIALTIPNLLKLNAIKVYVEAPRAVRWARFQKEYRLRGWTESTIEDVFQTREREEIPYIERSRASADFVLTLGE